MQLMLLTIMAFVLIGLVSRRFGPRQQWGIATLAMTLTLVQFAFSRFL
jgi:hypothetical protein